MKQIYLENLDKNKPYLLVFLDTLKSKKSLYYHDILLWWQKFFKQIKINVYIVTPDEIEENKKIKYMYHSSYRYISCKDKNILIKFGVYSLKNVFGNDYEVINANMMLIDDGKAVKVSKRINQKALKEIFFMALRLQCENFLKKVEKVVDTTEKL